MADDADRRDFARDLRIYSNDFETALWERLRNRKQSRFKFRRQHPIGPYFADFWCPTARVVVELDGFTHRERRASDATRDAWMADQNILVLRFSNQELEASIDTILMKIRKVCEERIR